MCVKKLDKTCSEVSEGVWVGRERGGHKVGGSEVVQMGDESEGVQVGDESEGVRVGDESERVRVGDESESVGGR